MYRKKIKKIFLKIFKIHENKFNLNLNNKNIKSWDSINHLKLMIALEEEFNVQIPSHQQHMLLSVKMILNFLKKTS